jgi:hypothetical protein
MSRSVDATCTLSDEQRERLDALSARWKSRPFPDGRRGECKYSMFRPLPEDIKRALESKRSRLLESEARILRADFGIKTTKRASEITRRKDGAYSVKWRIRTTSMEGTRIFYEEIRFPQNSKQ